MSSLLEQAFVDAKALKEAALKNAESTIVEKYSDEVKETLNRLLEQDELGLGGGLGGDPMGAPAVADADVDVPLAATDGDDVCPCPDEDDVQEVEIKFDELAEALQKLEEELDSDSIEEKLGDGKTQGTDSVEAGLDDNEEFTRADLGAEQGGARGDSDSDDDSNDDADDKVDEELDLSALVAAVMENFDLDESEEEFEESMDDEMRDYYMRQSEFRGHGSARSPDDVASARAKEKAAKEKEAAQQQARKDDVDPSRKYGQNTKARMRTRMQREEIDADSLIDAVMEKLTVDMGADLSGWAGRRAEDKMYEMEKELAARRSTSLEQDSTLGRGMADRTDTDPQKELEDLKQAQEELVFENNQLKEKLQDYENVVEQLKESVTDVNLSNARLLYTNRVLRNTSLNERQKDKVAEAISKAGSVPEAKTIFETLQSTVESTPTRGPQSLSETINRRSSILRASSRKETVKVDPLANRMKKLAGIN
tara:strand:+ start:2917 stop:4362 length:1446 start_codon:yes stop_codon:yes gene_type:complete